MIHIKTEQEIKNMRHGGHILAEVLVASVAKIKSGVTELEIDQFAEKEIRIKGGIPGFQKVSGYKHTICAATNEVVVHGIPSKYRYKEGDLACIDCGVFYGNLHTDMAETILVQNSKFKTQNYEEKKKFLGIGKRALLAGIAQAKAGNRVGHISKAIQDIVEGAGYSIVRSLVGHGVGYELHEEPEIPGFLFGKIEKTPLLKANMTIAVEVIYNMGKPDVVYANNDGWTIKTKDSSLSAVFERTILITNGDPEVLTV